MPGPINRHDKLPEGALTQRYRRLRHDDPSADEPYEQEVYLGDWDVDEYWDPCCGATPLDFHLQQLWEEILAVAFAPSLSDFASPAVRERWGRPGTSPAAAGWSRDELPAALHDHLEGALARATRSDYLDRLRRSSTLDDVRAACVAEPILARWFAHQRGPAVMVLVLAPFWMRSLAEWCAPETTDLDAITASLVDHLFVRYPLPRPLYHAWRGPALPALKWACWTVLLGGGASLQRAARCFDWRLASRFTHFFLAAPPELDILDAVMWAEIARLGGSPTELARLRARQAYCIDPTAPDGARNDDDDDEENVDLDRATSTRRDFWRATVCWLARHRDALTDEACGLVLDWAMHRHTEDLRMERPEAACFRWSGREPAPALEEANRYADLIRARFRAGWFGAAPFSWKSRNWNWDDGPWTVRELTSDTELADEGGAMHHCVATYAYLCAQGQSAIFSLSHDGARRATVQLDPRTRRIVQARGARNRPCDREELAVLGRWLQSLA